MSAPTEPLKDYVKRKLTEAGSAQFPTIAAESGANLSFIRKFFYGGRPDPRIDTLQPLITLFTAIDRGEKRLPELRGTAEAAAEAR